MVSAHVCATWQTEHAIPVGNFLFREVITHPATESPWNIKQFTGFYVCPIPCSLVFPDLCFFTTLAWLPPKPFPKNHVAQEMFTLTVLKILSSFEFSKQKFEKFYPWLPNKNTAKLKKKKHNWLSAGSFYLAREEYRRVNKQSHFILVSGTEKESE